MVLEAMEADFSIRGLSGRFSLFFKMSTKAKKHLPATHFPSIFSVAFLPCFLYYACIHSKENTVGLWLFALTGKMLLANVKVL